MAELETWWAEMLAWASEDNPTAYTAALKMDCRDFYRLVTAKRQTIQRLNKPTS